MNTSDIMDLKAYRKQAFGALLPILRMPRALCLSFNPRPRNESDLMYFTIKSYACIFFNLEV